MSPPAQTGAPHECGTRPGPDASGAAIVETPQKDHCLDTLALANTLFSVSDKTNQCYRPGGPTGLGNVSLRIDTNGTVSATQFELPYDDGGPVARCVAALYATVTVPPFNGGAKRIGIGFSVDGTPDGGPAPYRSRRRVQEDGGNSGIHTSDFSAFDHPG